MRSGRSHPSPKACSSACSVASSRPASTFRSLFAVRRFLPYPLQTGCPCTSLRVPACVCVMPAAIGALARQQGKAITIVHILILWLPHNLLCFGCLPSRGSNVCLVGHCVPNSPCQGVRWTIDPGASEVSAGNAIWALALVGGMLPNTGRSFPGRLGLGRPAGLGRLGPAGLWGTTGDLRDLGD